MLEDLSICSSSSLTFCLIYFEATLVAANKFIVVVPCLHDTSVMLILLVMFLSDDFRTYITREPISVVWVLII